MVSRTKSEKDSVETNITIRWEEGMPHHPESERLYKILSDMDFHFGGDYFCFKSGGDGDNGEHLMYLLDIHFEQLESITDANKLERSS